MVLFVGVLIVTATLGLSSILDMVYTFTNLSVISMRAAIRAAPLFRFGEIGVYGILGSESFILRRISPRHCCICTLVGHQRDSISSYCVQSLVRI